MFPWVYYDKYTFQCFGATVINDDPHNAARAGPVVALELGD